MLLRSPKGLLSVGFNDPIVIWNLASFRVRGDPKGVKGSLSNPSLDLNLTRGSRAEEFLRYQNWGITSVADYLLIVEGPERLQEK